MSNAFLDAVGQGQNHWWRYALNVASVLFATLFLGAVPLGVAVVAVSLDADPATTFNTTTGALLGVPPALALVLMLAPFAAGLVALLIGTRLLHRRSPRTLITPGPAIRWGRVALGAAVWVALALVMSLVEALLFPGRYTFTPNLPQLLPFALAALVMIPLQSSAEELFFRSYLLQGAGWLVRNPIVLTLLSALAFALPHAPNPEVTAGFWPVMAFYFLFGATLAALTLRTASAELALGVHAGNNLFTALFANFKGSALASPSLFTVTTLDPWYNLAAVAVALAIFLIVFGRRSA
jgi:uncharacterized protein